ncbi:hypothetical protein IWQ62_004581 [Dispira parvispora]|uniref:Uncharacterized protein n=1 Tax=Dispira parvispora TaxID=1520584 RepID=A0A9W8E5A2_9FUNG|nr:hypothetical protein IWQ62_004581 [Dispira parvispora]
MRSVTVMSVALLAMAMVSSSFALPTVQDAVAKPYPEAAPLPGKGLPNEPSYPNVPSPPIEIPAGQPEIPHSLNLVDLTAQIQLDLSVLGLVDLNLSTCTVVGLGVNNELLFTKTIAQLGISLGTTIDLNVDLQAAVGADLALLDQLVTLAVDVQVGADVYVAKIPLA